MTGDEAEDAQTIHPTPRNPPCQCPDPARACHCDDDGSAAHSGWELGEWMEYGFPERVSGSIADRSYVRGAPKILAEKPNAPDCSGARVRLSIRGHRTEDAP